MKIYLSWSGELGRRASEALRRALEQLMPTLTIWFPGSDISVGARWIDQTHQAIAQSKLAIVCVTNDSRNSSWLLYEIGVMVGRSSTVVPWLVDVEPSELEGPLAQFQSIRSDSQSFRRLVDLICQDQEMPPLPQDLVQRWALGIEEEVSELVRRGHKSREVRGIKEWLAQITNKNGDRQIILSDAESRRPRLNQKQKIL